MKEYESSKFIYNNLIRRQTKQSKFMEVSNISINYTKGIYNRECFYYGCNGIIQKILTFDDEKNMSKTIFGNKVGFIGLGKKRYIGSCCNHYIHLDLIETIMQMDRQIYETTYNVLCSMPNFMVRHKHLCYEFYMKILEIMEIIKSEMLYEIEYISDVMYGMIKLFLSEFYNGSPSDKYIYVTSMKEVLTIKFIQEHFVESYNLIKRIDEAFRFKEKIIFGKLKNPEIDEIYETLIKILGDSRLAMIAKEKICKYGNELYEKLDMNRMEMIVRHSRKIDISDIDIDLIP